MQNIHAKSVYFLTRLVAFMEVGWCQWGRNDLKRQKGQKVRYVISLEALFLLLVFFSCYSDY